MRYNKVELLSQHNCSRLFIDGTEIKGVTRLDIHRDANGCKTEISIDFECDLDTVERKKIDFSLMSDEVSVPFGDD